MKTTGTRSALFIALILCFAAATGAREREPNASYAERRAKLAAQVDGPVILFGFTGQEDASPAYVFAQEDYFYYLTGHNEEGAAVLVVPDPPAGQSYDGPREVLYLPARNLQAERWNGVRIGPDDANIGPRAGFAAVKNFATLKDDLAALGKIYPAFHTLLPPRRAAGYPHRQNWLDWLQQAVPGVEFKDATTAIATLRQIKSPSEMKLLTKAIEASMDAHLEAMRMMRPGVWEYEVAAKMEYVHKSAGCEGEGYAPIVGAAFNSTVLHYSMPVNQIRDGDVIVLDVGAKCDGYVADITRTLPAGGKFSARQREIYEIVLGAQNAVLAAIKPGMTMGGPGENSLGRIATEYINSHGKDKNGEPLGKYFIHGLGHHVGLNVHDPGPPRPLEPGMVVTIEPGIYIPDENLGVRIEDIVQITETGYQLLTARLPRNPDEVESLIAKRASHVELESSLKATAQKLIHAVEAGDSETFAMLLSADGVGFGLGEWPPIGREEILRQLHEKRGVYCLMFDTKCMRAEDNELRRKAGEGQGASDAISFRELFQSYPAKEIKTFVEGSGVQVSAQLVVELKKSKSSAPDDTRDFYLGYNAGFWELKGVIYN